MFIGELVRSLSFFSVFGRSTSGMAPSRLCPCIEKVRRCEGRLITNGANLPSKVQPEVAREVSHDRPCEIIIKRGTPSYCLH